MTLRCHLTAAVLSSSLIAGAAHAQELIPWGNSDYWDVVIDPSLGNGCLIQSAFDNGSIVRIGFDQTRGSGYLTAFNLAWGGIEEGTAYEIAFSLDDADYAGVATGVYLSEVPGAEIFFDNPDFLFDIAASYAMTIYAGDAQVMTINLSGSYQALEAALQCQSEQG